ncbi:hypothetical protein NE237_013049 [Protea cynaroides]|uniref:Uncharacterized protein n=1 Tax=Protea cynaroides TaxID=273540 RepID=A0A9Q0JY69_9MAGN|nr:hypothetical protein NE237_013049 [Protea cynaroides]
MCGWRSEVGKDQFSHSVSAVHSDASVTSHIPSMGKLPFGGPLQQPQVPMTQQLQAAMQLLSSEQFIDYMLPEKQRPSVTSSLSRQSPTISPLQQTPNIVCPVQQSQVPVPQQLHAAMQQCSCCLRSRFLIICCLRNNYLK